MKPEELAEYAEREWIGPVSAYIRNLLGKVHLPSHDFDHHFRVWKNLRTIIAIHACGKGSPGEGFISQALLSAFFHDTGMITDRGPAHGQDSRMFLEEFLLKRGLDPEAYAQALEAVEKHDDKTYSGEISLLTDILGMADDVDAFGRIGAVRYAEIYTCRGGDPYKASEWVIPNLESRFRHLEACFPAGHPWIAEQEKRYTVTMDLFSSGMVFLPVVRLVDEVVNRRKSGYMELCEMAAARRLPLPVREFFRDFEAELMVQNAHTK